MVGKIDTAAVRLWGQDVGAVAWLDEPGYAVFEYETAFLDSELDISPLRMSLEKAQQGDGLFSFPALKRNTFLGLPGLLADSLPDKFGHSIIDTWLSRQGRHASGFSPVERLCFMGRRGMGAIEFHPCIVDNCDHPVRVEPAELVQLAQQIMSERNALRVAIGSNEYDTAEALIDILRVGTSAGGARPKAVVAINDEGDILSGQTDVPGDYDHWILKFDGVTDIELGEPRGYGRIEYAYHLMATAAGIDMMPCRLLEEGGRAHFITRRFDRADGEKLHMQTLCGLAHFDFNILGAYSYEQAFSAMRRLRLSRADAARLYRRMIFNVLARNQDDHTKNITFLMGKDGRWELSPAYDVIYSHNPAGKWTNRHQMTLNGKRDEFNRGDMRTLANSISLSHSSEIYDEVHDAVSRWPEFAQQAGIKPAVINEIAENHRQLD